MGVRKRDFQLIAIPFHYFVENRLIMHSRNHVSSNCLSSPSNTKFTEHLVWNGAFLCVLQATLLKQETYTTLREDKAWKDQSRVAVQHQNLHHEEQGPGQQKRKKRNQCLWIHRWRPAFLWASLLEECPSAAEKQTFQKHIQMCTNTYDVFLILITTCSWFIIKTCLFSLMTWKAVTVLTSEAFQLTSRHLPWAISLLFLEDTWWCSPTWGLRRSTS